MIMAQNVDFISYKENWNKMGEITNLLQEREVIDQKISKRLSDLYVSLYGESPVDTRELMQGGIEDIYKALAGLLEEANKQVFARKPPFQR